MNEFPRRKCDLLLLTVNKTESRELLEEIASVTQQKSIMVPINKRHYSDLGVVNGTRLFHTVSQMGTATAGGALQSTQRGITDLNPRAVIGVGVAFGIDEEKQTIGDILVSSQIAQYEPQRVGDKVTLRRGAITNAPSRLVSFFTVFEHTRWEGAKVRFGTVLTGEKLIDNIDFRDSLKADYAECLGGEMEAAGIQISAADEGVDWIIIKGICDWADGKKAAGKDEKQKLAARNAAAFLTASLSSSRLYPLEPQYEAELSSVPTATQHLISRRGTDIVLGANQDSTSFVPSGSQIDIQNNIASIGETYTAARKTLPGPLEEVIWRIIDDIKTARKQFSQAIEDRLLDQLEDAWEADGMFWPNTLRRESLLILAESAKSKVLRLSNSERQAQIDRFRRFTKELEQ